MEKNAEKQFLEEKIRLEAVSMAGTIRDILNAIGQIEINKHKILESETPDPNKIGELEISKKALIIDSINLKQNFKIKLKEGLREIVIKSEEAEKYSIDLQTGEIRRS
jgi:hypothetical protein